MLVKLTGGIGNQLFQYAFGCYLSQTYHCQVKYFPECGTTVTDYEKLNLFLDEGVPLASDEEIRQYSRCYNSTRLAYRIYRRCLSTFGALNRRILVEIGSKYNEHISPDIRIFDGYWQSYRYLEPIDEILRNRLHFPSDIERELNLDALADCNSVSIHARFGDYLNNKNKGLFVIQDSEYYIKAIAEIKQRVSSPVFYVFSNDIVKAREMFSVIPDVKLNFVQNSGSYADLKDMCMMSHCQHSIISNSTFSWWAAWMGKQHDRIVIAPKKWYIPQDMNAQTINMIPPQWIRV